MNATRSVFGTAEGVVRRFYLKDGSLMQLRHQNGFTEAVLYWYNKRTTPNRIERVSARFQSLAGSIKGVLEEAKMPDVSEDIAKYVRATHWGSGWPN